MLANLLVENVCVLRITLNIETVYHKNRDTYINANICTMKKPVIILDHHPCLFTARSKHHARTGHVGRAEGLLDGR